MQRKMSTLLGSFEIQTETKGMINISFCDTYFLKMHLKIETNYKSSLFEAFLKIDIAKEEGS